MPNDERLIIVGPQGQGRALWTPISGRSVEELGRTLEGEGEIDRDAFAGVTAAAIDVLSQAAPPVGDIARRTGLVVGYVQSGKTMSMTATAALARDNGYRMVIVFAGVASGTVSGAVADA